jgi:pimeloyl-ACP methyl ester carboxylesterase
MIASGLNRDRDLILLEQRGSYFTTPALTCPVIDEFQQRQVGLVFDAASTAQQQLAAVRTCRRQLVAKGANLSAYNTTENALDFVSLRHALGIKRWNVFGVSYGADLALRLMRDDPSGIRSVTLDSTVPTDKVALPGFWTNARDGFDAVFRACAAQPACAQRYPGLKGTFTQLVRNLEANPVTTTVSSATGQPVTVVLDGGALVNWLLSISEATPLFPQVPADIEALAAGNPQPIAEIRGGGVTPPGFVSYGLLYGVACREWTPFAKPAQIVTTGRQAFPRYPTSLLRQAPQFYGYNADCQAWKVPPAPKSFRTPTRSTIPTLILSGEFDAITSDAWAEDAARTLPNSKVVQIPGVGHSVLPVSKCAQSIEASFLASPMAPSTKCLAGLKPAPFATALAPPSG